MSDEIDRLNVPDRTVKVHIAAEYAIRRPEEKTFVQRCSKCGRALRAYQEDVVQVWALRSDNVDRFGLPAGTLVVMTRDAQYITGPRLGANEEFCS